MCVRACVTLVPPLVAPSSPGPFPPLPHPFPAPLVLADLRCSPSSPQEGPFEGML